MDALDWLTEMYNNLMSQGWTLPAIDDMDINFFIETSRKRKGKSQTSNHNSEQKMAIDQLEFM